MESLNAFLAFPDGRFRLFQKQTSLLDFQSLLLHLATLLLYGAPVTLDLTAFSLRHVAFALRQIPLLFLLQSFPLDLQSLALQGDSLLVVVVVHVRYQGWRVAVAAVRGIATGPATGRHRVITRLFRYTGVPGSRSIQDRRAGSVFLRV